jgi:hypothetical protein
MSTSTNPTLILKEFVDLCTISRSEFLNSWSMCLPKLPTASGSLAETQQRFECVLNIASDENEDESAVSLSLAMTLPTDRVIKQLHDLFEEKATRKEKVKVAIESIDEVISHEI